VLESVKLPVILITAVVVMSPLNPVKLRFPTLHAVGIAMRSPPLCTLRLITAVDDATIDTVLVVPEDGEPVKLNVFVAVIVAAAKAMLNTVPLVPVILTTPVVPVTN
jgi:hypothetical protein